MTTRAFLSGLVCAFLFMSLPAQAKLACPPYQNVQALSFVEVAPNCDDGGDNCGRYIAGVMFLNDDDGKMWVVIAGEFDSSETALADAEQLVKKSGEPSIAIDDEVGEYCLYYADDANDKFVAGVPFDKINQGIFTIQR